MIRLLAVIFKNGYKKIWVPIMGRFLSFFIPILEGKRPDKLPTYDIDGNNSVKSKK